MESLFDSLRLRSIDLGKAPIVYCGSMTMCLHFTKMSVRLLQTILYASSHDGSFFFYELWFISVS